MPKRENYALSNGELLLSLLAVPHVVKCQLFKGNYTVLNLKLFVAIPVAILIS